MWLRRTSGALHWRHGATDGLRVIDLDAGPGRPLLHDDARRHGRRGRSRSRSRARRRFARLGARSSTGRAATSWRQPQQAQRRARSEVARRRRRAQRAHRTARHAGSRTSGRAASRTWASTTPRCRAAQPAADLLLDQRLRPDRPGRAAARLRRRPAGRGRVHGRDRLRRTASRRAPASRSPTTSPGLYAVQGILLALHDRQTSGLGQHVDIALFDSMLSVMRLPLGILLATGNAPSRVGNDHPSIAPYETLKTPGRADHRRRRQPGLWKQFCAAIERADLPRRSALCDQHRSACRTASALKAEHRGGLRAVHACRSSSIGSRRTRCRADACGRSSRPSPTRRSPRASVLVVAAASPGGHGRDARAGRRLSRTPAEVRLPPPALGEHPRKCRGSNHS